MPRESQASRAGRLRAILEELRRTYPEAHCELRYRNPLELLIATILSAQCSDVQVNRVTETLFQRYSSAADFAQADPGELEAAIRSIGLFRNKARNIRACCQALVDRHGGAVPESLAALIQLNGVGRKTANVVLGNAFGRNEGVVVDTHVARLAGRLRLSQADHPERIEQELMTQVPPSLWTQFSHWLIWHGRRRCSARQPDCAGCEIREWCPSSEVPVPHCVPSEASLPEPSFSSPGVRGPGAGRTHRSPRRFRAAGDRDAASHAPRNP